MMKRQIEPGKQWLCSHGRLCLVVLATLLLVGLLPHWVNAESAPAASFTSPLPHPTHDAQIDDLRETLRTIIDRDALTAAALGISVDELKTARESGVRLDELITKLGLDEATVHQAIQAAFTAAVEQAVTDGLLTQEQANLVLTPPAPRGDEGHHGPNPAGGDHHPGDHPNNSETPVPTSATPVASSLDNSTTDSATPAATPEHRPRDRRGDPNAQDDQPTGDTASTANATTNTGENSPQNGNGETGGPHNRPAGNRRSGR